MTNQQHEAATPLLWACNIDATGKLVSQGPDIIDQPPDGGYQWVHLQSDNADALTLLSRMQLPESVCDGLCALETRPKAMTMDNGVLLFLRGINRNPDADPQDMVSLRVWIDGNRIVTARRRNRRLMSVQDVKATLDQGEGPTSPIDLVLRIITRIADRISETVDDLDEALSDFEAREQLDNRARLQLSELRRQAAAIRRYLAPQRDALDAMYRLSEGWSKDDVFWLREQTDRMTRYVEDLDLAKERAMVLQDELRNRIAEQQGMRMYVLSLITAIFLPLSFLTGVFGMNVAGLPGTEDPQAFTHLAMFMAGAAAVMLVGMLWKRWL
ncbi:zinc transporter ZntB [Aestuariibacter halophilus]|uniref:Zinc transporter ZntB n=1 Tax=Fluctibacter halophilus TaxID=226011 RepID=A0ABS8GAP5_9ALTE|nr:zinc transporter ZntB [Aestuariibacter halophilus]MCC2617588.1 zinc transporter ZntB [Aestuariibacter halophilus]